MFLAVSMHDSEVLSALTPHLMLWRRGRESSSSVWLLDLRRVWTYWLQQARAQHTDPRVLWQHVLGPEVAAAVCLHPWQAVLMLRYMHDRNLQGVMSTAQAFGEKICMSVSWEQWWCELQTLGEHFEAVGQKRFQLTRWRAQCLRMRQAVSRMSLALPVDLREMSVSSIQKRFGQTLSWAWQWMWGEQQANDQDLGGFPWQSYTCEELPSVQRSFEFPVSSSEQLFAYLSKDVDGLLDHPAWREERRVVELHVGLRLSDGTQTWLRVHFRHPHDLQSERGEHATLRRQLERLLETMPFQAEEASLTVLAWEWCVYAWLKHTQVSLDLFGEQIAELADLHALENRLYVPLTGYRLAPDPTPEHAHTLQEGQSAYPAEGALTKIQESDQTHLGLMRPLWVLPEPRLLAEYETVEPVRFLECTSDRWWDEGKSERMYWLARVRQDQVYADSPRLASTAHGSQSRPSMWAWVFQRSDRWWLHGLYA